MPKILTLKSHLTKNQLRRKYVSCQHSQEKKRWQALSLIAQGEVANTVAETLGMSSGWISNTVHRYHEGGVVGVKNKSKNESSKTLSADQVKALDVEIESGKTADERLWSATQIKRWVSEQTGRQIHRSTAWRMFARIELYATAPAPGARKACKRRRASRVQKKLEVKVSAVKAANPEAEVGVWSQDEARFG